MKYLLSLAMLTLGLSWSLCASAANTLAKYAVTSSIPDMFYRSGEYHLLFNADSAAFVNVAYPVSSWVKGGGKVVESMLGDPDQRLYLTTIADSTVRWKTHYGGGRSQGVWSILSDPYPRIAWRATGASRINRLGQSCLEAEGKYGGRDYTVWYIPSVPTYFGPWMLHGLPGLVDELRSADGMIDVRLVEVAPSRNHIPSYTEGAYRTYAELQREVIKHLHVIEAIGTQYNASVTSNDPCRTCEIELDKWDYIKKYKLAEIKAGRRKRQANDRFE